MIDLGYYINLWLYKSLEVMDNVIDELQYMNLFTMLNRKQNLTYFHEI